MDYLDKLPKHPIFQPPKEGLKVPVLVIVRQTELIVLAGGSELRLASLVDLKSGRKGAYRVRCCSLPSSFAMSAS